MKDTYTLQLKKRTIVFAFALMLMLALGLGLTSLYLTSLNSENAGDFHVYAYLQRAGSNETVYLGHHSGSLTIEGEKYIQGKLGAHGFSNNTYYATYLDLSNSSTTFSNTWVDIPNEITVDGLARANATYASVSSTQWTLTYQWTASATNAGIQRVGVNYQSAAGSGSLMWADTITSVTLYSGDKLTIIATTTVAG